MVSALPGKRQETIKNKFGCEVIPISTEEAVDAHQKVDAKAAADLAEEIDNTLLQREDGVKAVVGGGKTPLLMAVADLKAMRPLDPAKPMPLDAQTLRARCRPPRHKETE